MRPPIGMAMAFVLIGCVAPQPPPDAGPQTAALVVCVKHNSHGRIWDGYIINSVGDPVKVKRMFDDIVQEGIPDTTVSPPMFAGWSLVEEHQKNAVPLPVPASCGPPQNSN
jgi:hypothetical protein